MSKPMTIRKQLAKQHRKSEKQIVAILDEITRTACISYDAAMKRMKSWPQDRWFDRSNAKSNPLKIKIAKQHGMTLDELIDILIEVMNRAGLKYEAALSRVEKWPRDQWFIPANNRVKDADQCVYCAGLARSGKNTCIYHAEYEDTPKFNAILKQWPTVEVIRDGN